MILYVFQSRGCKRCNSHVSNIPKRKGYTNRPSLAKWTHRNLLMKTLISGHQLITNPYPLKDLGSGLQTLPTALSKFSPFHASALALHFPSSMNLPFAFQPPTPHHHRYSVSLCVFQLQSDVELAISNAYADLSRLNVLHPAAAPLQRTALPQVNLRALLYPGKVPCSAAGRRLGPLSCFHSTFCNQYFLSRLGISLWQTPNLGKRFSRANLMQISLKTWWAAKVSRVQLHPRARNVQSYVRRGRTATSEAEEYDPIEASLDAAYLT
ncbi:hypothetical protein BJ742DRAFT_453108 [Cladochytrium replicatum]|nr:hypothetical protein BJ742DRAFT_453108 [Cladochytrium replicatum]